VLIKISFLFYLNFPKMLPSVTELLPSAAEIVPAVTEVVPSATEIIPSATEIVPSVTEIVPSVTEIVPSVTEIVPSATEIIPSVTEMLPSATEFVSGIQNLRMNSFFINRGGGNIVKLYRNIGQYSPVRLASDFFSTVHESKHKFHLRNYDFE
jgi:phage-related protein